jgi:hypothetical protein
MSNSSRIEAATRDHVGATLTNDQIVDLVKVAFPDWKGGVYASDAAYKRTPEGLQPRGKTAYGDGVLEYLAENSFKVLPTEQIVRRPSTKKVAAPKAEAKAEIKTEAKPEVAPVVAATAEVVAKPTATEKKASKKQPASQPPVPTKSKARDRHVAQ